ncbi:MAG: hypothetical protein Q9P01_20435 [Anaerolineae bacterium]|nr:hypothetical protein [Anaerolineae bacterium]
MILFSQRGSSDNVIHRQAIELIRFDETFRLPLAHFLYHLSVALLNDINPTSLNLTIYFSVIVLALANTALAGILWYYLQKYTDNFSPYIIMLIILSILLLTPASLLKLNFDNPNYYAAYFHSNPLHNPTFIFARPFTLLLTLMSISIFGQKKLSVLNTITMIIVIVLGILAKPNYIIAFLLALCLFAIWRFFHKQPVQWRSLIFAIAIPAIIILSWQFYITYTVDTTILNTPEATDESGGNLTLHSYDSSHRKDWLQCLSYYYY